ncbi:hypothetical protein VHEMI02990 [[Torrubiella] hemipterigena]|uniref:Uncharacterized protein n=1 Tax=[Torrubiella] hemipterigena TaxID=1531966 RepID=A0A0A1T9I7_9HYPO|nr:hypothetical protein VHEMI02990 [[Torrubiella] hemipterigena]
MNHLKPQGNLAHVAKNLSRGSPAALRPVMSSLNGDHSWLISIPRPIDDIRTLGKAYFHIVYDPWLSGAAITFKSWLISISLVQGPSATCAADVEALVDQLEEVTMDALGLSRKKRVDETGYKGGIDMILLGFHFTDHVHKKTLTTFDARIPVLATQQAMDIVAPWNHFVQIDVLYDLKPDDTTWQHLSPKVLPDWVSVVRMLGHHELNFLLAFIWTHSNEDGNTVHEAVVASPHGVRTDQERVQAFFKSEPPTRKLAMLHGIVDGWTAGWQNTFGFESGVPLHEALGGCSYWVTTHSAPKWYRGLFLRMAQRERQGNMDEVMEKQGVKKGRIHRVEVANGDALVLV